MTSSENNSSNTIDTPSNDIESQVVQPSRTLPPTVYVKNEPEKDKCLVCKCMILFGGVTLMLSILFGTLVLYGFNIYSLTLISNKTIHKHCENSNIWEWMITFMVISLALGMGAKKKSEDGGMQIILDNLCQLFVLIGLTCWGSYEIWGVNCVDKSLLLYTLAQVTVGYCITVYGIIILVIGFGCTAMLIETKCMKKSLDNM